MTPGLTDQEFIEAFEACTIPKPEWSHRAHVRMAWIYLSREGFEPALDRIREGIRRYSASIGKGHGYHETVTVVYARLVHHCLSQEGSRALTWDDFESRFPILFDRASPPSLKHYKEETLKSDDARARFIEPDVSPLPALQA